MNIQKKIKHYYDQFEVKDRNSETIVVFKEDRSNELQDSVHSAHGDRLPDNWIFNTYYSILSTLDDYDINTIDDVYERQSEIVDGLVDAYTSDLTKWLNSHNSNVYYITQAQEEYGLTDGFEILQRAQYMAIDEIYGEVASLLSK